MQLAGYRPGIRLGFPAWLTAVLAVLWVVLLFREAEQTEEAQVYNAEGIHLLYVDREVRLLQAGAGAGGLGEWVAGANRREEALRAMRDEMAEWADRTEFSAYGVTCLAWLHAVTGQADKARAVVEDYGHAGGPSSYRVLRAWLRGEDPPVEAGDDLHDALATGAVYGWERGVYRLCFPEEIERDAGLLEASDRYNGVQLRRALTGFWIWVVVTLVAAVAAPRALRRLRSASPPRFERLCGLWCPSTILGLFFGAECLVKLGHEMIGNLAPRIPLLLSDHFWLVEGFLYMVAPAFVMVFLLFRAPGHAFRVLTPRGMTNWAVVLFGLGTLSLIAWILDLATAPFSSTDPLSFLWWVQPSELDLFFDLVASVIVGPAAEELVFRGFLFLCLRRRLGTITALLLSSTLFAVAHTQYDLVGVIQVWTFGLGCGVVAWRTRSIVPGLVIHSLYNLLLVLHAHSFYYAQF